MDKDFLEGLAGLLNQPAEEVSNLFEAGEQEGEFKAKPKDEILNAVKSWVKTRTDDVYKAAQRKTATGFEGWIKSQGFESDKQGTDLLAEFAENLKANAKPGDDDVKVKKLTETITNLQKALEGKDDEVKAARLDAQKQIVTHRLKGDVMQALGPKWAGTDEHLTLIMSQFDPSRVRYDGDTPTLLGTDGEPMTDDLMRPVKFADYVTKLGKLTGGFHAADPNTGSGNAGGTGGSGTGGGVKLPANMDSWQFKELLDKTTDPEKRKALLKARAEQIQSK